MEYKEAILLPSCGEWALGGGGVPAYDKAIKAYPPIKGISGGKDNRGTFAGHVTETGQKCDITERAKPKEWESLPSVGVWFGNIAVIRNEEALHLSIIHVTSNNKKQTALY